MDSFRKIQLYLRRPDDRDRRRAEARMMAMLFLSSLAGLWPAFLNRVLFDRAIPYHESRLILPVLAAAVTAEAGSLWSRRQADRLLAAEARRGRYAQRVRQSRLLWSDGGAMKCPGRMPAEGTVIQQFEDAALLGDLRSRFLGQVIGPSMTVLLLLPVMVLISPELASLRLLLSLPAFLIGGRFLRNDLPAEQRLWRYRRTQTGQLIQGSSGAAALDISGASAGFRSRLRRFFHGLGELEEHRELQKSRWQTRALLTSRGGNAVLPAAAALLIMSGRLSFGSFIAFSIIAGRTLGAAGEVFGGLQTLARSSNAAVRREALETGRSGGPSFHLSLPGGGRKGLMVRGLDFSYPSTASGAVRHVLSGVSLSLAAGERIRLTGRSGAGKSTLLQILLGLLYPDAGRLIWNGENLAECPPERRRRLVGGLLQSPGFFDASIRDNLTLFAPSPGERKLQQALDFAGASDIVRRYPGGIDAPVQGIRTRFSGGELQRLAVARMLLSPAPLLLLDEPFSAMDAESIHRACQGLHHLAGDCSIILVHHGPAMPLSVDRVLTVSEGRLV